MFTSLTVENFRNFSSRKLNFDSPSVILTGANGQGKTSLLEALYFLVNLRSFRTTKLREMQKLGTDYFNLSCTISNGKWNTLCEVSETVAGRTLKVDGVPVSRASNFTGKVNMVTFLPDDNEIISGSSQRRRRFFNMFISMLDRHYFESLQHYAMAVKTRNCLLHTPGVNMDIVRSYNPIIAENGLFIVERRLQYAKLMTDCMSQLFAELRPEFTKFQLKMKYARELETVEQYVDRLDQKFDYDREKGYTSFGPHLDDFDFVVNDRNLRIYGSNGQKRIVSFVLKMAQYDIINMQSGNREKTAVIVDDATGDLDYVTKNAFFDKIRNAGQLFFAFTDLEQNPLFKRSQIIAV